MNVKIIECPRDAMQGIHDFIPTELKISYINHLLRVGFDTLDFGSFVSPKAIPQLADTEEVLAKLDLSNTKTKLLAIVANLKGVEQALRHEEIKYLGFPFSISETFQRRNTNTGMMESMENVKIIQELCVSKDKELVIYISMGFGNPYGDVWNVETVERWVKEMNQIGVRTISLSDTIGIADINSISYLFKNLIPAFPNIEFGAHLHTTPNTWEEKVHAAYSNGCLRFDGAIKGYGGCPMASDTLTGNMPTENLLQYFSQLNTETGINMDAFNLSMLHSANVFNGRL